LEESVIRDDLFGGFGFAESIAEESKEAAIIKNKTPIMVVIGNPPYSVSSSNKGKWITDLIKDYKKNLNERKINLDDDYIKFIRFAEHFIEKNKSGIVAMITNNSFIDGITHRQMRKHLLETFDDIYILDLHGNAKKKEKAPDGSKDENVFDIQQGVSINIFVRKEIERRKLANVYHSELFGIREGKFNKLTESNIKNIKWNSLYYTTPNYFFIPKDFRLEDEYKKGLAINNLLLINSSGVETQNDFANIFFEKNDSQNILNDFIKLTEIELKSKYHFKDGRDWKVNDAKRDLIQNSVLFNKIQYRPFDLRFINYTGFTKGITAYPRFDIMRNFTEDNFGLIFKRGFDEDNSAPVFISNCIIDRRSWSRPGMQGAEVVAPLYLNSELNGKIPNLNNNIVEKIEKNIGKVKPEELFDYIYAILHSPGYREKYKEFLKIDFPRVPYPKDKNSFKELVKLGTELRLLHLLESPKINKFITTYPVAGTDKVEKPVYKNGSVHINNEQYFGNVPEIAWSFYIGGYQPAQKWLKDRKGRTLTNEDTVHYQKIIVVLTETDRIMKEIDIVMLQNNYFN
ncbi:MAG: hypothetical protein KGZ42_13365, partial [Melioribacter sp.]|nr:hypothetical protein [Melioribacter sp.]